jgi:DNA mismatch repair protein MutS2
MADRGLGLVRHQVDAVRARQGRHVAEAGEAARLHDVRLDDVDARLDQALDALERVLLLAGRDRDVERVGDLGEALDVVVLHRLLEPHVAQLLQRAADADGALDGVAVVGVEGERERVAERESRQDARRYLLDARAEIDRTIKQLKSAELERVDELAREARQRTEQLAAKQQGEIERLEREEANVGRRATRSIQSGPVQLGDMVQVAALGGKLGRVMEVRGDDAVVAVGAIKLTVARNTLARADESAPVENAGVWMGDQPEVYVPTELDLRGMRPDGRIQLRDALANSFRIASPPANIDVSGFTINPA